jgi:hypothetical protein
MGDIGRRYGLRGSGGGYFLNAMLPRLKISSFDISADGGPRVVWIDAWPEQFSRRKDR